MLDEGLPAPTAAATPTPHTGTRAGESLLARARCYALLGRRRTALLDFNAALRTEPGNVATLCGRGLLHLALGQQQVARLWERLGRVLGPGCDHQV